MKTSFTIFCFVLVSRFLVHAQTGFFLIVESKEKCSHTVKSVDFLQEYCITEEPIISASEFRVEGNLQYDLLKTNQFFNIRFTNNGFETLKLICDHMPERQLVLVVNARAAGIYDGKKLKPAQLMPILGKADSKEIIWVFENLKSTK